MKLGSKILKFRKENGLSQEELADKLDVSRQTISKWELNETSPDIMQVKKMSQLFRISLDELLDNDVRDILTEKISNTERLSGIIIRTLKVFGIGIIIILLIFIIDNVSTRAWFIPSKNIDCQLGDKTYQYHVSFYVDNRGNYDYNEKIDRIERRGGNAYLGSVIDIEKYEYYYQLKEAVFGYFERNGGTCKDFEYDE